MHHEPQQQVAVLVLNWNGRALLEQFLPSWVEHTRGIAELIIVDNGSTDDSLPFLHQYYPEVRVLSFDTNYGFAEGYNRAIRELDYPIVVLLNSDAGLSSGWLDEPLRLLTEHPDVAAIQPTIVPIMSLSGTSTQVQLVAILMLWAIPSVEGGCSIR